MRFTAPKRLSGILLRCTNTNTVDATGLSAYAASFSSLSFDFHSSELLGLFDQHQSALCHHGKLTGCGQHLVQVTVSSVQNGLIEIPLVLFQRMCFDRIRQGIQIKSLFPTQEVKRREFALPNVIE